MTVQELLASRNLTSALVVDDAYDEVPLAEDLDDESWTTFIDDLGDDKDHVVAAFPAYEVTDGNDLRESDEFVSALWKLRGTMREDLWKTLFDSYEIGRVSDRAFLEKLEAQLKELGVTAIRSGRVVPPAGSACGIIFADLFLGAAQKDPDMARSLERLRELLDGRESNPPLVILMSRSPLLQDRKAKFRDDANLLGALFRVYAKQDLVEGSTLERTLGRLASNHADGVRVAAFVSAWKMGLEKAAEDFLKVIRRLDLSDYCQIREVLLDYEGQPLGSYLLDVFDRLLQHEIEGQKATIDCAQELNKIDLEKYPAPYISGSPDLQELVFRSIWQHPNRLSVKGNDAGIEVSFGDVLVRRARLHAGEAPTPNGGAAAEPDALIVLTPACDLVRPPADRRVLLLAGSLAALDHKTWSYKISGVKTPIMQLPNVPRMSISWDMKDVSMPKHDEISALISPEGKYSIVLRLRESHAIELQQKLLADMGRVGLITHMPFTFSVGVEFLTPDTEGNLKALAMPVTRREGGVCMSGRDKAGKDLTRLILTEAAVDEILTVIAKIDEAQVNERSRPALARLKASGSFQSELQRGLSAPGAGKQGNLVPVRVPAPKVEGQVEVADEIVGIIVRNASTLAKLTTANDLKNGAVVISLTDVEPHSILIGENFEAVKQADQPEEVQSSGDSAAK
jgi:hypothetical protein